MGSLFNGTCPIPLSEIRKPNIAEPIFAEVTTQDLMVYISLGASAYTTIACSYLAISHLLHYVRAREQRQIIRLCFYPLFFAVFSTAAIYSYPDSIYLEPARDLIEPISLAALFLLFLEFAEPDPNRREEYFSSLELRVQKGTFKKETRVMSGGSYRWFQGKWVALFCYFIADVVVKIVEIITQAAGRYCQSSFSLAYAHVWTTVISYIALPVGIVAVIQFYLRIRHEPHVRIHRTSQKIWAFKGVLLLNFVQDILFTILVSFRVFKGTKTVTLRDFQIGMPACLLAVEQIVAATLFIWAFPVKPYEELKNERKMNPAYALLNACNITDLLYGSVYALRLLAKGVGPYGNGTWNKKQSGYNKIRDPITDIHMKRSRTFKPKSEQGRDLSDEFRYEPSRQQDTYADVSPPPPRYSNGEFAGNNPYEQTYEQTAYQGSGAIEEDRDRLLAGSQTLRG